MNLSKALSRITALALSVMLLLTQTGITVYAEGAEPPEQTETVSDNAEGGGLSDDADSGSPVNSPASAPPALGYSTIVAFAPLDEEVAEQAVVAGTAQEDLALPETLSTTVENGDGEQTQADIPVEGWSAEPEYDPLVPGTYLFTPELPEGYTLEDGVEPPEITVQVFMGFAPMALGDYHAGDVAVINGIIRNNGLSGYNEDDPDGWGNFVDWTGSSPNRRVERLDINSMGLTGTLDVSGLSELIMLFCQYNDLTGLTLGNLGNFQTLNCSGNKLTALDLSGLDESKLASLSFAENAIASLAFPDEQVFTVTVQGNGTVKMVSYNHSYRTLHYEAEANAGHVFDLWSIGGEIESFDTTVDFTMPSTRSLDMHVTAKFVPAGEAPQLDALENARASVGSSFMKTIPYTYTGYGTVSFDISGLPSGLTYNSATGTITGSPDSSGLGGHTVTVAIRATGLSDTGSFTLTVDNSPAPSSLDIAYPPDKTVTVGTPLTIKPAVTYTGNDTLVFVVADGNDLPAGLSIDFSTGVISGAPTAAGYYGINIVVAEENDGLSSDAPYNLTVDSASPQVDHSVLKLGSLSDDTVGVGDIYYKSIPYQYTGSDAVTVEVTGLPGAMEYSYHPAEGYISGTIGNDVGAHAIQVKARAGDFTDTASYILTVNSTPATSHLTMEPLEDDTVAVGTPYTRIIAVTYVGTSRPAFSATGLPAGISIDPDSGRISGTPTEAGIFDITVTGEDSGSLRVSRSFQLTVTGSGGVDPGALQYTLNLHAETGGSIVTGTAGQYRAGDVISIAAQADTGYRFEGWSSTNGGAFANEASAATAFITPAANTTVIARFFREGTGSATERTLRVENGSGSGMYEPGDVVTVTASPAPDGKVFDGWELTAGGGTLTDDRLSTTTFTMPDSDATITATYRDIDNAGEGGDGGGSTSGSSRSSGSSSSGGSSTPDSNRAKTPLPASAFSWDGNRTLTIDHDSITPLGLLSVRWDGVTLTQGTDYTVHQGSVILRFGEDFIAGQRDGQHTVRVEFANHTGETIVKVGGTGAAGNAADPADDDTHNPSTGGDTHNPQTGDFGASPWWWMMALLPAAAITFGSAGLIWRRLQNNQR